MTSLLWFMEKSAYFVGLRRETRLRGAGLQDAAKDHIPFGGFNGNFASAQARRVFDVLEAGMVDGITHLGLV